MKKLAVALTFMAAFVTAGHASQISFQKNVINSVLTSTANYDVDLSTNIIDQASVQLVYSTVTAAAVTFVDGVTSTGNITVSSLYGLTTTYATMNFTITQADAIPSSATITIISTTGLSGETLSIAGLTFKADTDWPATGASVSTQASAKNLAALLNSQTGILVASSTLTNIVYSSAAVAGLAGNDLNISSSKPSVMSVGGFNGAFTGGLEKSLSRQYFTFYINGASTTLREGSQWTQGVKSSNTAISIVSGLNANYSSFFVSTVTVGTSIVYSTAATAGTAANSFAATVSTVAVTVSSPTFIFGQDNAVINIGGYKLTANKDWFPTSTTALTAINISSAINNSALGSFITSTYTTGVSVVYCTSTVVGAMTKYSFTASTTALTMSPGGFLSGGTDSDIITSAFNPSSATFTFGSVPEFLVPGLPTPVLNSIKKAPTNFGVGMGLLLTKTAGTMFSNVANNSTYYATNLTATSFQLASNQTNALAGTAITITTTTVTGGGTFVLTPIAFSGTPNWKLQVSNDDVNFQDLYVFPSTAPLTAMPGTVTFATPYTAGNVCWTIGDTLYRWLRLVFNGPIFGGINFQYIINGKNK